MGNQKDWGATQVEDEGSPGDAARDLGEAVGGAMDDAKDKVSDTVDSAVGAAQGIGDRIANVGAEESDTLKEPQVVESSGGGI